MRGRHFEMAMARAYVYNKVCSLLAVFVAFQVLNHVGEGKDKAIRGFFVGVLLCYRLFIHGDHGYIFLIAHALGQQC